MKKKYLKKTKWLLISVISCSVILSVASFGGVRADALVTTQNATILSGNYYRDTLQVQYRIVRKSSEQTRYEYSLRYSSDKSDFDGAAVADDVPSVALAVTEAEFYTVSETVSPQAETLYYTVECKTTTGESAPTYAYTAVREAVKESLADTDQAYLMDCGSNTRYAFYDSSEAAFTVNQSSAWQAFGEDPLTGKEWGIVSQYEFSQVSSVASSKRNLMGSALNSSQETMTFKFETDDDSTAYNVVMGFKDQNSSRINSAGEIYVNGGTEAAAEYVGAHNGKIVAVSDVKATGNKTDGYFIELAIKKSAVSRDLPLCNFISIRKQAAEKNLFLGAAYTALNVTSGTTADKLPSETEIYTTAGKEKSAVSYKGISDSKLTTEDKTYYATTADAEVTYNGKTFELPVDINVWTAENIYYFVDCAQTLPFSAGIEKYEWLKNDSETLINTDALDKQANGSGDWGWYGAAPTVYWGNIESYASIYEGTDYNISYNFPNLPAGNYTLEIGVTDPWGPRTTRIFINDEQLGYIETKTGQKAQKTVSFRVENDNDPVFLRLSGANSKPLVGWMMISENSNAGEEKEPPQSSGGCGSVIGGGAFALCLTAAGTGIILKRKYRKDDR